MNFKLIEKARSFCIEKHKGQCRKYGFPPFPYFIHPFAVADWVQVIFPDNEKAICAAYLHDILEDTKTPVREIDFHFGKEISFYVLSVTNFKAGKNRKDSLDKYFQQIISSGPIPIAIKICDIIDNCRDASTVIPTNFCRTYLKERLQFLDMVEHDFPYRHFALDVVNKQLEIIGSSN